MLSLINSKWARRIEKWLWEHPKTTTGLVIGFLVFVFLPQWAGALWYWFTTDAPVPTVLKKIEPLPVFTFSLSWITGPIGVLLLALTFLLLASGKKRAATPVQNENSSNQAPSIDEPRRVSFEQLEADYELKKLEPNFVDQGNDYVSAYNDEYGVIVQIAPANEQSFHVLARSFGNQHPRQKVRPLKKVSFRIEFICFDRATRNSPQYITIPRGAWLNEAEIEVPFPAHCPPRKAVVVTVENENRVYAVKRADSSYKSILPLREELTGVIYSVHLTLLVESQNNKPQQYILEIIREPNFELQLNEAVYWKSHHLGKFVAEGTAFLERLLAIWQYAKDQVPAPPPANSGPFAGLSGLRQVVKFDYSDYAARVRAIEQEQEGQLLGKLKEWEAQTADFVDLFISVEQRDKFVKSVPSIDDGFNRAKKSFGYRLQLAPLDGGPMPPPKLAYWMLTDAVKARTDVLMEIIRTLR